MIQVDFAIFLALKLFRKKTILRSCRVFHPRFVTQKDQIIAKCEDFKKLYMFIFNFTKESNKVIQRSLRLLKKDNPEQTFA